MDDWKSMTTEQQDDAIRRTMAKRAAHRKWADSNETPAAITTGAALSETDESAIVCQPCAPEITNDTDPCLWDTLNNEFVDLAPYDNNAPKQFAFVNAGYWAGVAPAYVDTFQDQFMEMSPDEARPVVATIPITKNVRRRAARARHSRPKTISLTGGKGSSQGYSKFQSMAKDVFNTASVCSVLPTASLDDADTWPGFSRRNLSSQTVQNLFMMVAYQLPRRPWQSLCQPLMRPWSRSTTRTLFRCVNDTISMTRC